ncbi:MAG: disulfide bond formation protein B [Patescibacteria group bacterium]
MLTLETLNYLIAVSTIGMQVASVALLVVFFFRKSPWARGIAELVTNWGLWVSLLLVVAGTLLSLVYSEYFGIVPCGLCWLQRVFLYPQVVLFALATWKKSELLRFFSGGEAKRQYSQSEKALGGTNDSFFADYSIVLSFLGGAVALYQHYLQMGGTSALPCPASGVTDCAKRFLFEFDYITFPLVAFSSFALLFVIMLFVRQKRAT